MPFSFYPTDLPEVILVKPKVFEDNRGSFQEVFQEEDFDQAGINFKLKQINNAVSKKGVLRGLHYQNHPMAMDKFIRVINGVIFDVAVDIRTGSPAFGHWFGLELSREKNQMLFIPKGFAHGFCVLSEVAEVMYYCSELYAPDLDKGIRWDDPTLNIDWPIEKPILSLKDQGLPLLEQADCNLVIYS